MDSQNELSEGYIQVRRVLAAIAAANEDIDDQERMVIASSLGGAAHLNRNQMKILLDDALMKPDIASLVTTIDEAIFVKQLIIDLTALSIIKNEWHPSEIAAINKTIDAIYLSEKHREQLHQALNLLRIIGQSF